MLGSIRVISLQNNALTGSLPSELGLLPMYVRDIHLGYNSLEGTIPVEFATNTTKLVSIHLNNNRLSGTVPDFAASNSGLSFLNLVHNDLTGSIVCDFIINTTVNTDCGGDIPEVECSCCSECFTDTPTYVPTSSPSLSFLPSSVPTTQVSIQPSNRFSIHPTLKKSEFPTREPSYSPSLDSSYIPSSRPSASPSKFPSIIPSTHPSIFLSSSPSLAASLKPTSTPSSSLDIPSSKPSASLSNFPSILPSTHPSIFLSTSPSLTASVIPSSKPSASQSNFPSILPSTHPSIFLSTSPSLTASMKPTSAPSSYPTLTTSMSPSILFSQVPTYLPSQYFSSVPSKSFAPTETYFEILSTMQFDNEGVGNMFDIFAFRDISIHELDIHTAAEQTYFVAIYIKSGSYIGTANDPSRWTQVTYVSVTGRGSNMRTPLPLSAFEPINIPGESTQGFYVTLVESIGGLLCLNANNNEAGSVFASTDDMEILIGTGNDYLFGQVFGVRVFNGALRYMLGMIPTESPTVHSSTPPSVSPSLKPSMVSASPSVLLTSLPSLSSSSEPSSLTTRPSMINSSEPSLRNSLYPSMVPSSIPTMKAESQEPSLEPSVLYIRPTVLTQSAKPTSALIFRPSNIPTKMKSTNPTASFIPTSLIHELMSTMQFDNEGVGNMFNIFAFRDISIHELDIHTAAEQTYFVAIYIKSGSYIGTANDPSRWTQVTYVSVTGRGSNMRTPLPLSAFEPINIPGESTQGFYVTLVESIGGLLCLNANNNEAGSVFASTDDMEILIGTGNDYLFGQVFGVRVFNGALRYMLGMTPTKVPTRSPSVDPSTSTNFPTESPLINPTLYPSMMPSIIASVLSESESFSFHEKSYNNATLFTEYLAEFDTEFKTHLVTSTEYLSGNPYGGDRRLQAEYSPFLVTGVTSSFQSISVNDGTCEAYIFSN